MHPAAAFFSFIMRKIILQRRLLLAGGLLLPMAAAAQVYKDPKAPVELRVNDLLSRMTPEEKAAQLTMHNLKGFVEQGGKFGVCESPFTTVQDIARQSYLAKKYAREQTRLGIPPIQIGECLHGQLAFGATIFPQAIAQGSTWNPALVAEMAAVIAEEAAASGVDQALSPLFDLARDPRYGRVEECFGEDPWLVGKMGVAFVTGMQGPTHQSRKSIPAGKIMCTAKHFAAYSVPVGGINLGPSSVGMREMRSHHLLPFEMAVKEANVYAIMPSYNETDGIPAHASGWLLNEVLRGEWGFPGYVFADYGGLSMLVDFHKTAADRPAAALHGLQAGVDLEAPRTDVYGHLPAMLADGRMPAALVDTAVKRVLRAKFMAGLFEKPYPDTFNIGSRVHTRAAVALARRMAEESVILLQNKGNLLPLDPAKLRSIAVIGPNADQVQYGDYSFTRDNASGVTVLRGIRELLGNRVTGSDTSGFAAAVQAAAASDVAVVVLGESSAVLSGLGWGVGLGDNEPKDPFTGGEGYDVTDLDPPGVQRRLIQAIWRTGKPVVLVTVKGRAWSIGWEKENIPAILEAWYPGEQGGHAVAGILFGKVNPSGRLPVSIPRSAGHVPVFYDHKPSGTGYYHQPGTPEKPGRDYVFSSPAPLFPFGHGLSYTTFRYDALRFSADTLRNGGTLEVLVDVTNTGSMAGMETVQLYVRDKISSVTTPVLSLKGCWKKMLKPGKTETAIFQLLPEDLALWNTAMQRVTEPGSFEVLIGRSSEDIVLNKSFIFY